MSYQIVLQTQTSTVLEEWPQRAYAIYRMAEFVMLFLYHRRTDQPTSNDHYQDWRSSRHEQVARMIEGAKGLRFYNPHLLPHPPYVVKENDAWELVDESHSIPQIYHLYVKEVDDGKKEGKAVRLLQ